MPKLDKSQFTKQQWKVLQEHRRNAKRIGREQKENQAKQEKIEILKKDLDKQEDLNLEVEKGKIAFVLGNGVSRKPVDPKNLKMLGKVYGCNALYRHFEPDYLIAVDTKMILEINKSGYQKNHEVWTNPNRAYSKFNYFNYFNPSKGWSSGPTALWLASEHKYETIYILGFDYRGLNEGTRFNNVYADTPNYKKSVDSATFFGNWMRQTASVIQSNPHINYVRVITDSCYIPKDLVKFKNLIHMNLEDFNKTIQENLTSLKK